MLESLYIKDFILIDELQIDFANNFSVFTGETGAGKSIFIDSISILTGGRLNSSMVRTGCKKAIIEGVFSVNNALANKLEEAGYDNESFIVTREINNEGKSVTRLNQRVTSLSFIKECLADLVDIHCQHDNQYLLNEKYHLQLLDSFVNNEELANEVAQSYKVYSKLQKEYDELLNTQFNPAQIEALKYQVEDIEALKLKVNEEKEIEETLKTYKLQEKLSETTNEFTELFENGILDKFYRFTKIASQLEGFEKIKENIENLTNAYYSITDDYETVNDYLKSMSFDISDIDKLNERLYRLQNIKRKYGCGSIEEVVSKCAEMKASIAQYENRGDILTDLKNDVDKEFNSYLAKAKKLSEIRKKAAIQLEKQITNQLVDLSLPKAKFKIEFSETKGSNKGIDDVRFLISTNPGQPLAPLAKVASGGEISRLMLGLKAVFTKLQGTELIIFDEIDTGVSGEVAFKIGLKMAEIAKSTQVFAVTHLSAVAAFGDNQYKVVKLASDDNTLSSVKQLDELGRIEELAAISSSSITKASLEAAKELLERARACK